MSTNPMKVMQGRIVAIEYSVKADGKVIEATESGKPVEYLHGSEMLLPDLEAAIEGWPEGKKGTFTIANAYGPRDENNVISLPRHIFPTSVGELFVGARLAARTDGGDTYPMTVVEISGDVVTADLNHPLAGKDLHFDVAVKSVRVAGNDEIFSGKPRAVEMV